MKAAPSYPVMRGEDGPLLDDDLESLCHDSPAQPLTGKPLLSSLVAAFAASSDFLFSSRLDLSSHKQLASIRAVLCFCAVLLWLPPIALTTYYVLRASTSTSTASSIAATLNSTVFVASPAQSVSASAAPLRIALLTNADSGVFEWKYAVNNKQCYAAHFNYSLILDLTEPPRMPRNNGEWLEQPERPLNKVYLLAKWLPHYDWVLWHDLDTIFTNFTTPLTDLIPTAPELANVSVIVQDADTGELNAGAVMIRNNDIGRAFLQLWTDMQKFCDYHNWQYSDQGALLHAIALTVAPYGPKVLSGELSLDDAAAAQKDCERQCTGAYRECWVVWMEKIGYHYGYHPNPVLLLNSPENKTGALHGLGLFSDYDVARVGPRGRCEDGDLLCHTKRHQSKYQQWEAKDDLKYSCTRTKLT